MKKLYFKKRIPEPSAMGQVEQEVFKDLADSKNTQWLTPICDEIFENGFRDVGLKILDVGSGPGHLIHFLAKKFPKSKIVGLDRSTSAIFMAKKLTKNQKNVSFKMANASKGLPFADESFDIAILKESLHEIGNLESTLVELRRVVKKGGMVYVQDLRRDLPWRLLKTVVPPKTPLQKLQYYSTRASYTKKEICSALKKVGIQSYKLRTRNVTKETERKYINMGVTYNSLKDAFQARFFLTIRIKDA